MRATVNGAEIYFDVDGMGLAPDGGRRVEQPVRFLLHGGPGGDHSGFKTQATAWLREVAQLVYVDHRGAGRGGEVAPGS